MFLVGLEYYPSYVTEEEAALLMRIVDSNPFSKDIRRRQQHYGIKYYHTRDNRPSIQPSSQADKDAFPLSQFDFLIARMTEDGIFSPDDPPTQCLVNEYLLNVRIASHLDNFKAFGPVVAGLSLGDTCLMTMRLAEDERVETKFFMDTRSLYVMRGDARYKWKHGITAMKHFINPLTQQIVHRDEKYRRISLTFRKILQTKNGDDPHQEEDLRWRRETANNTNMNNNRFWGENGNE